MWYVRVSRLNLYKFLKNYMNKYKYINLYKILLQRFSPKISILFI